jgi:hypothetical protein
MRALAPGRPERAAKFHARPTDLSMRSFSPTGLTMRECQWCSRTHTSYWPSGPEKCSDVAGNLRHNLNSLERRSSPMSFQVFTWLLRPDSKISLASLQMHYQAIADQRSSAEALKQEAEKALQRLRETARASGLATELAKLEHPTIEGIPDRDEAIQRVRVRGSSFSNPYKRVLYYGSTGEVLDLPLTLAKTLVRNGQVEEVPSDTPLYQRPINNGR